jgi:hypothetical protein
MADEELHQRLDGEAPIAVQALHKGPIPIEMRAQLRAQRRTRKRGA